MKIKNLHIKGYKNLIDTQFDFTNCSNYVALIGINGSGKSNVLETISLIFNSLYYNKKLDFSYSINYKIEGKEIKIEDGKMSVEGTEKRIIKKDIIKYLPHNVITSYSGEELRMWEDIYIDSYAEFFKDLKKKRTNVPDLLYINKFSWEIALITLLASEKESVKSFIKNVLGIKDDKIEIEFDIDESKYGLYKTNEALSLINRLKELIESSQNDRVHINEIRTLELNQQDNNDFTKMLFYYLFITAMPERSDKIKVDKIIKKIHLNFNNIDIKKLSEGEKKLILITLINEILSDENSLILLDEPDAHLHIERKKDIKELIQNSNAFTLLTTHSPTLLNILDEKNIFILSNKDNIGISVVSADKSKHLSEITGGIFSLINATLVASTEKDILLVEGTNDYNYLTEALKRFKNDYPDFNFLIINCGGAGNVAAILEQSVLPILSKNQLCVCTFDEDKPGKEGIESVEKVLTRYPAKENNVKPIHHPQIEGFQGNTFFMEDYFSPDAYKKIILNEVSEKQKFRDYEQMPKAKKVIKSNYKNFDNTHYKNFKVILSEILKIQRIFHKQSILM